MSKNALLIFFLFPGVLLIVAPLISFPYGFYIFLRLIVSITAAYIIFDTYKNFKGINETIDWILENLKKLKLESTNYLHKK